MLALTDTSTHFLPIIRSRSGEMGKWIFSLEVPHSLWCLPDHFPGNAMVPGFVQVEWVRSLLEAEMGISICIVRCDTLKFLSILRPGDVYDLVITGKNLQKVEFRAVRDSEVVALGKLTISRKSSLP